MKVFICLDDKNGMMFNKRRQSKDRVVIEKVKEIVGEKPLYVSEYTHGLFEEATICKNFENFDGYAFIEDPIHIIANEIEVLYIFKWNRHYPSDRKFNLNMKDFDLESVENFVGYSHENITLEIYKRRK